MIGEVEATGAGAAFRRDADRRRARHHPAGAGPAGRRRCAGGRGYPHPASSDGDPRHRHWATGRWSPTTTTTAPRPARGCIRALDDGKSVAYASEAGTPLVADPGYQLARAAIAAGHPIFAAPGPSAVLAALTVSGLPTDRFLFAGFPPATAGARIRFLAEIAEVPATIVLYESPKRVSKLLRDLVASFGGERQAAICRELTKRFEEVSRGTLAALAEDFAERSVKGEIVLVIDRPGVVQADAASLDAALRTALAEKSVKDAVSDVAAALNLPRRQVYQAALRLEDEG